MVWTLTRDSLLNSIVVPRPGAMYRLFIDTTTVQNEYGDIRRWLYVFFASNVAAALAAACRLEADTTESARGIT